MEAEVGYYVASWIFRPLRGLRSFHEIGFSKVFSLLEAKAFGVKTYDDETMRNDRQMVFFVLFYLCLLKLRH